MDVGLGIGRNVAELTPTTHTGAGDHSAHVLAEAYREGLSGNRDPEDLGAEFLQQSMDTTLDCTTADLRDEEVQIQVLGAMGGAPVFVTASG
ncbi:unnamed protein product [Symbiodinium necroappetens]|uniref:Uncharacterized protein n=1 Tax=Symbiodinium necroappetens TaxID=1628268 RepID=A0A812NQG5_9DINO|nr:unnamed protein product [Symbiodinium necroappetens]